MNLDMMYEATNWTGNPKYAEVANSQAEKSSTSHVRPDYTTFHVVNMDQKTGKPIELMTAQGESVVRSSDPADSKDGRMTLAGLVVRLGRYTGMLNAVSPLSSICI